jgi:hypothetical protein
MERHPMDGGITDIAMGFLITPNIHVNRMARQLEGNIGK